MDNLCMSYYHLNVDTRSRTSFSSTTSTDCQIKLPYSIKHVHKIEVISAEVPNTAYVFSAAKGNTTVTIDSVDVTIPDGNYDSAAMEAALIAAGFTTAVISDVTAKLSFTDTVTVNFPANSDGRPGLGYYLGFEEGTDFPTGTTYTGDNAINLAGESYVLLKINNDFPNMLSITEHEVQASGDSGTTYLAPPLFCKLVLRGTSYSVVTDNEGISDHKVLTFKSPIRLDRLNIGLYDYYGDEVDLNGAEFSITLRITSVEDPYCQEPAYNNETY